MSRKRLQSYTTRLKNSLLALLFVGTQVIFPLTLSGIAHAAAIPSNNVGFSSVGFVLGGDYSVVSGQPTGSGQLKNGNVGAYPEGACIPAQFNVTNNSSSAGDTVISPIYDYYDNGVIGITNYEKVTTSLTGDPSASADNLNDFAFTGQSLTDASSFPTSTGGTVSASVTGPYSGETAGTSATSATDSARHYNISLTDIPAGATVYILLCARLGLDASQYPGASLSMRTVQGGKENVPIPVNQLLQLPSITINKTVSGGSASASDFSFNLSPDVNGHTGSYTIPAGKSTVTIDNVNPDGTYSVSEVGPSNYLFTNGSGTNCTVVNSTLNTASGSMNANVAAGKTPTNATCNFTNTYQQATLILQKTVINDNGGTLVASNFPVYIGSTLSSWGTNSVAPGTYTVSETQQSGYAAGSWGGNCSASGSVTLANGETKTCTITNNDIAPQLTVIKHVVNDNGGSKTASNFTMNVTGTDVSSSSFAGAESPGTTVTLKAGSFSVDEGSHTGYTETMSGDCSGTIAIGESKTCTITNDDIAPQLTLIKYVTNDNGGTATADQWTLSATPSNNSYTTLSGAGGFSNQTVQANVSYTLGESGGPSGYSAGSWNCNNVNLSGSSITLGAGDNVTCSITNDDIAPRLTVTKVVTNDNGGQLQVSNFPLYVTDSNNNITSVTSGTQYQLDAGTYTVSETQQTGYTLDSISGACLANGSITLEVGGVYACTLTNNDIPATITVTKVVHNNHGGTAGVSDFKLYVGNTQVTSGVTNTFAANQQYTITEQAQVNGYHQDSIVCTDTGTQANLTATFTPTLGEHIACTITNSDVAPQLTVIKHVVNDNGGTKTASDFTMNVTGTNVSSSSFVGAESPGTTVTLNAGSYSVDEGSHTGYSKTLGQDCSGTIALGETKTCVITNNDSAPSLTLVKHVTNDNGGQRDANEWTLTATGTGATPTNLSGAGGATSGTDFMADTYTLGESGPTDYSQGSWSCTNSVTVNGNDQISLSNGQSTVCTITNDDIAPTLKLVKTVTNDNGGSAKATDWNLSATPSDAQYSTLSGAGGFDFTTARANLQYTLAESTGPSGYAAGSWSCDGGSISGNKITLGLSENVTCTITNNDVAPKLTLVKLVTNNAGSTASATDWTLSATPSDNQYSTLSGAGGFSEQTAQANEAYTLGESGPANFSASDWSCTGGNLSGSQLTLAPGNDVTCYVTNTRDTGTITVNKTIVPSNDSGLFNLTINGLTSYTKTDQSNGGSTGAVPVQTGTYKVSESAGTNTDMSDYSSTWSCNNNTNGPGTTTDSFTVSKGSSIECTFTNTHYAHITVIKNAIPDSSQKFTFHFGIPQIQNIGQLLNVHNSDTSFQLVNDGGNNPNNTWTSDGLAAGTYYVSEDATTGWDFDNVSCSGGSITKDGTKATITVAAGDTVTCTYTNRQRGEIIVHKVTDPSNDTTNFTVTASGTPMINGATAISGNATRTDLSTSHDVIYDVAQGSYSVSESAAPGWIEDDSDCSQLTLNGNTPINNTTGVPTVECTITNTKQATITVTKFNDIDQNGQYDIGKDTLGATETSLPGWQMTLTNGDTLTSSQQTTGNDGSTTFNYVDPGFYSLSETQQNGWQFSNTYCDNTEGGLDGPYYFTVEPGANLNCYVGNYRTSVVLNLSKTNNKPLPTVTGDTVQYTLIVTVPDNSGSTFGTTVTDLPPKGFTYVPGSWTATSTNSDHNVSNDVYNGSLEDGGNGNPTYASPGTWHLGTLIPGETVTLTYLATIGSSVSPGTYPDVAYASGYTTPAYTARVLSNLSTVEDPFVGTQVTIRAGEVLAAQIVVLANTGTSLLAAQFIVPILLIGGIYITRRLSDQKGGRA